MMLFMLLTLIATLHASFVTAQAIVGVNITNLGWRPPAQRTSEISNMANSGVRVIRIALTPPFPDSIDAIREAKKAGLGVLLNINLNFAPFYPPEVKGRSVRHVIDWPLSRFDPAVFRAMFMPLWRQIDSDEIALVGLEFGNEINWAGYNADLGVVDIGETGSSGMSRALTEFKAFREGMRKYVDGLAVLHQLRAESNVNRGVPIISAGLATVAPADASRMGSHYVNPAETLALLRTFGMDDYVDGYGIHFYPVAQRRADGWMAEGTAFSICRRGHHPCWVTEWGVANQAHDCEWTQHEKSNAVADNLMVQTMSALHALAAADRIRATFYFDWDGVDEPFAIWRCGRLSQGARVALGIIPVTYLTVPHVDLNVMR